MELSQRGVEFIAPFENIYESRYCPFYDPYGKVYTRAFGETDWSGNFGGKCISHAEALANLKSEFDRSYAPAINNLNVSLNENQFIALADAVWNLGPGSMEWDIGRELRAGNFHQAALDLLQYDTAGGVVLPGLAARRRAEYNLFMTPVKKSSPSNPLDVLYPNERRVVNSFLAYRKHPKLHRHGLRVTKEQMINFRGNIFDAATYGRLKSGQKTANGWNIRNRKARYELLRKYTT